MKSLVLRLALLLSCAALTARAAVVNPVADTVLSSTNPNSNYGGAGSMEVSANLTKGEFDSLFRFDLASVKSGFDSTFGVGNWTLSSITLALTVPGAVNGLFNSPATGNFSVTWLESDAFVEGTGNPTTPTTDGAAYNTLPSLRGPNDEVVATRQFDSTLSSQTYSLNLTPRFSADVSAGHLVSFVLTPADSAVAYPFNSRTGSTKPQLDVQAVPEPASVCLLALGFAVCGTRRRRAAGPSLALQKTP